LPTLGLFSGENLGLLYDDDNNSRRPLIAVRQTRSSAAAVAIKTLG